MSALSDNVRGAVYMMLSMAGFVLNDTLVKSLSENILLIFAES